MFFKITMHARERYVTRILNPEKYKHLNQCGKNCNDCLSLLIELYNHVQAMARQIDSEIGKKTRWAIQENSVVTDINFIQTLDKSNNLKGATYYKYGKAIFAVRNDCVVTVLSLDMIDGTTILLTPKQGEKKIFNCWKQEAKRKIINV